MSATISLRILATGACLAVSCGNGAGEDETQRDAGDLDVTTEPQPQDPSCKQGAHVAALPTGPCITGAACELTVSPQCPDGYTIATTIFSCQCATGSWSCEPIGGGLNLHPCVDAGDAGDAAVPDAPSE